MINAFPKSLTIELCEEFIRRLAEEGQEDQVLVLPVETAKSGFAGYASAIQAMNTWKSNSKSRQVVLKSSVAPEEDQISELIKKPHKFCAAMYAKTLVRSDKNEVEALTDLDASFRILVNEAARVAIEGQSTSTHGQQYGRLCWFAFVDHSTKGFDRNFYRRGEGSIPEPRQSAQITAIIKAMVEKSMRVAGGAQLLADDDAEHLGRVFYELFLNTHEHGSRAEVRRDWVKPAVRVIYANGINLAKDDAESSLSGSPILRGYISSRGSGDRARFVEISMIDAGLGYYKRWLADHPEERALEENGIEREYDIFKTCFSFRKTSTGQSHKGMGLPVVMDRLTKLGGFMRVRSGRLSLYRDFVAHPYEQGGECDFFDWNSQSCGVDSLTDMPNVAGVAVTLLIPVEAR
jgi:hypothetical protein